MTDGNIVTSRNPDDVEAFTNALIDLVEDAPEVTEIRAAERAPPPNRLATNCVLSAPAWTRA